MTDRLAPDVSWAALQAATPPEVAAAFPAIQWRLELLWQLDRPARRIAVADLDWMLDLPLWQRDGVRFQVRPRDVLAAPAEFPAYYQRIVDSDLAYPIQVIPHRGRMTVLDGFHRVAKTIVNGGTEIEAIEVSLSDLHNHLAHQIRDASTPPPGPSDRRSGRPGPADW